MKQRRTSYRNSISRRTMLATSVAMAATPALAEGCQVGPPQHHKGPPVFMDYDQLELDASYDQVYYEPLIAHTEAFPWNEAPRHLIRDRDQVYGAAATRRLRAMGIRDKPIAPGSPWQNGFAERLIGSIRRECVDHIVVLGEMHLRRVLKSYARYYNETRTHRSLDKDATISRPVQRDGSIMSHALIGGLHHHYIRV